MKSAEQPRVELFPGILTGDECEQLIALSMPRLVRSTVLDRATGSNALDESRTSAGGHFKRAEFPIISELEDRLFEWVTGTRHTEPLQVLRYLPGERYLPHHDWFDPKDPGSEQVLHQGGQRIATVLIYLNEPSAGGETSFPQLGFSVRPMRGAALGFWYPDMDARCQHGGEPVVAGEKWVMTQWVRERAFW